MCVYIYYIMYYIMYIQCMCMYIYIVLNNTLDIVEHYHIISYIATPQKKI